MAPTRLVWDRTLGVRKMGSDAAPLEASLAKLVDAAKLLGLADVAGQLGEAQRRLAGVELEVAVVGEFKRGKSTLLNALIDAEVLPAGVLPLTAVPTVLSGASRAARSNSPTGTPSSTTWARSGSS
jgi:ribosome biogenesis GTPase A